MKHLSSSKQKSQSSTTHRGLRIPGALLLMALCAGCITVRDVQTDARRYPGEIVTHVPPEGAIRHVVLFAFKEGTPPDTQRAVEEAAQTMVAKVPGVRHFEWGTDLNNAARSEGFTHCMIMTFNTPEELQLYLPHPAHAAFKEEAMPHIARLLVLDYRLRR